MEGIKIIFFGGLHYGVPDIPLENKDETARHDRGIWTHGFAIISIACRSLFPPS